MIEVEVDRKGLRAVSMLTSTRTSSPLSRSLHRAGVSAVRRVAVDASRHVRSRKRYPLKAVKKGISRISGKRSAMTLDGFEVRISGKHVPVAVFRHRAIQARGGKRGGMRVFINKRSPSFIAGGFSARMKSGHVGVFVRRGKKSRPIKEAMTTRIRDTIEDKGVIEKLKKAGAEELSRTFHRLMQHEMAKLR